MSEKLLFSLQTPLLLLFIAAIFLCFPVGDMSTILLTGLILTGVYLAECIEDAFIFMALQTQSALS